MSNKDFTPITILLIEDNPTQEGIKAKDLKSRGVEVGDLNDNINVPGINFKKEKNKDFHKMFTLKILQHPEEIKEYITNCLEKEDKQGSLALGKIHGAVPEIVEFDYKLGDNFQINSEKNNMKYFSNYDALRKFYNPNFLFDSEKYLEKDENINYTVKDFIERINNKNSDGNEDWYKKDESDLIKRDDELGLYAGVEITRLFRNHICIGIPATFNFNLRERLHVFGKFFEWINDYDLGTMFSSEERGSKDWDTIIASGVKQLRVRIETQVQIGKATIDYSQLSSIAQGNFTSEDTFSFETIYGKRNFPLQGLFIDIDNIENLKPKIQEWANYLLNKLPINSSVIKKAIETSTTLWNTYINDFEDRIILSDYTTRLDNLNLSEKAYLNEVKIRLGVNSKTGLISNECSIQTLLSGEDNNIIRLTMLILVTRASIALEKQRLESNFDEKYSHLKPDEYFNLLYPKANLGKENSKTIILPMNFASKTEKERVLDSHKKWLMRSLTIKESDVKQADIFYFEDWILKSEKEFLKSMFYGENKYYPQWVK